jgi:hypothetical protein
MSLFRAVAPHLTALSAPTARLSAARFSSSDAKVPSKDDLNPTSKESTRSATNDEIAHDDDAAYNPNRTNPVDEKQTAGREVRDIETFPSSSMELCGGEAVEVPSDVTMFLSGFWL